MTISALDLEAWIGKQETSEEVLTAAFAARFSATFDLGEPPKIGEIAPFFIQYCLAQSIVATSALAADGHPSKGGFLPPVPLPIRMWAGGETRTLSPIYVGATLSRRSVVTKITHKNGSAGPLCFVTVMHFIDSDGVAAIEERQDIVYRSPTQSAPTSTTRETVPCGAKVVRIVPDSRLLFRYSALTFNSHRIHYDSPYTIEMEGYADLVVHGPLQATLLAQAAASWIGHRPSVFSYRLKSPIVLPCSLNLNGEPDGVDWRLWSASDDGPVSVDARAIP